MSRWEDAAGAVLTVSSKDLEESVNKVQGHTLEIFTPIFMCDDNGQDILTSAGAQPDQTNRMQSQPGTFLIESSLQHHIVVDWCRCIGYWIVTCDYNGA